MKRIIILFGAVLVMAACERRPMEELFIETASIDVAIDWSSTGLDADTDDENLYRASVYLFANSGEPFDGKSYREYPLNSPKGGSIEVPIGEYSAIIFNNSTAEFSSNVGFRNLDSYDDFEYYSLSDDTRSETNYVLEPDLLGAWTTQDIKVTSQMVITSHDLKSYAITEAERVQALEDLKQLSSVEPELLTSQIDMRIYSSMIKSASQVQCDLIGFASSLNMSTGAPSAESGTFEFSLESRTFDSGSTSAGYISGTTHTMGFLEDEDARYYLEVRFMLVDEHYGSWYYPASDEDPFRFDITDQLLGQGDEVSIVIDIGFEEELFDLPEIYVAGGFEPSVDDWGDEESLDIPI